MAIVREAVLYEGSRPTGEPWYSDVLTFNGPIAWAALATPGKFATKARLRKPSR